MKEVPLKNPYPNGVVSDQEHLLEPYINLLKEIRNKINAGERVYIKITSGERKGSIAYIVKFDDHYQNIEPGYYRHADWKKVMSRVSNDSIYVILGWDKRRNRIKWSTHDSCVYLPDYKGPTVWKKFDKKAAEKKMLKENPVLDRDGNQLSVGDRVLYINARYGSGASLDRGTIEKIKYSVQKTTYNDSEYSTPHVIIKNDNGEESDIKAPELSILRMDKITEAIGEVKKWKK
jgi:hypothetical protein